MMMNFYYCYLVTINTMFNACMILVFVLYKLICLKQILGRYVRNICFTL